MHEHHEFGTGLPLLTGHTLQSELSPEDRARLIGEWYCQTVHSFDILPNPEPTTPAITFLGNLQRLEPKPGDVYVLQCEREPTAQAAARIKEYWAQIMGDTKLMVLSPGMTLGCIAAAPKADPAPLTDRDRAAAGIARANGKMR